MKKLNKKGFTLIELIVVIAILAILAAILIPSVTGYIAKATAAKDTANCRALYAQTAMELMLGNPVGVASGATSSAMVITYTTVSGDTTALLTFKCVTTATPAVTYTMK